MRRIAIYLAILTCCGCGARVESDLVITNARVIAGTGEIIERGSVVISNGRIASVSEGSVIAPGEVIDANGLTVIPGLIDTHRHVIGSWVRVEGLEGAALEAAMEERLPGDLYGFLEAGITTIMSNSDPFPEIVTVKNQLRTGELQGPRLLGVGPSFRGPSDSLGGSVSFETAEDAKQFAEEMVAAGVDGLKIVYDTESVLGVKLNRLDDSIVEALAQVADENDIPLIAHATQVEGMLQVIELGADRLNHTPHTPETPDALVAISNVAQLMRENEILMSTTVGYPLPEEPARLALVEPRLRNLRHLMDEGVLIAFGTDRRQPPAESLAVEIETLSRYLTNEEILSALTLNAARYLYLENEIGTLERGKIADIVIVDGDPLRDIEVLANVEIVVQGGQVVVDNR